MASVTSLDQDMRKLRLDRYTPAAAAEVRSWIESTLGERLPAGDLLDALKDGVVLCKLANLALPPPGIKYKASSMPFVQMENISHFLSACERAPFRLPAHDRFLTVDLYDSKDPAQVVQCLSAFSRAANAVDPGHFPTHIGPRRAGGTSPTRRPQNGMGTSDTPSSFSPRNRGVSNASQASDVTTSSARAASPALTSGSSISGAVERTSRFGSPGVSSWSKKADENITAPAWNIHQYGYMGGASQANQGISFGSRRQIVSQSVQVPSVAEKEKRRKEQEAEAERRKAEALESERQAREEREAEEEHKLRTAREQEREELEQEKRRWEEEEKRWREEDERRKAEEELEAKKARAAAARPPPTVPGSSRRVTDAERIKELEKQLEQARTREQQYQLEREQEQVSKDVGDMPEAEDPTQPETSFGIDAISEPESQDEERQTLREEWDKHHAAIPPPEPVLDSLPHEQVDTDELSSPPTTSRPLPAPSELAPVTPPPRPSAPTPTSATANNQSSPLPRPLPDPRPYYPASTTTNRTDRFLATNPAPPAAQNRANFPSELSMTSEAERAAEDARRRAGQESTKAGGWASKSLLEREMEKERERQKEWEEAQVARMQRAAGGRSGGLLGPRELRR